MTFDTESAEYRSLTPAQRQLLACGFLAPKKTKKPLVRLPKVEPIYEPHDTLLAQFTVPGRAVAWQTHGRPHPGLRRWQRTIKKFAEHGHVHGQKPYQGTIELYIEIFLCKSKNKRHPDLTNAVKAIEDAMQGVIYVNDMQVRRINSLMEFGEIHAREQDVEVCVYSCGKGHD